MAASQRASIAYKRNTAQKIVASASATAAAAGASPIPFSDAALLIPIQIGMLAGISSTFDLDISRGSLATLVSSALGAGGATLAGRAIVTNLLKFIPGGGTVAGGFISAATAGALTAALGEAYVGVLSRFLEKDPDVIPDVGAIGMALKEKLSW